MKFYGVDNRYYNNGKVKATIITCEADTKPEDKSLEAESADMYIDWFDTLNEAQEHRKQCLLA